MIGRSFQRNNVRRNYPPHSRASPKTKKRGKHKIPLKYWIPFKPVMKNTGEILTLVNSLWVYALDSVTNPPERCSTLLSVSFRQKTKFIKCSLTKRRKKFSKNKMYLVFAERRMDEIHSVKLAPCAAASDTFCSIFFSLHVHGKSPSCIMRDTFLRWRHCDCRCRCRCRRCRLCLIFCLYHHKDRQPDDAKDNTNTQGDSFCIIVSRMVPYRLPRFVKKWRCIFEQGCRRYGRVWIDGWLGRRSSFQFRFRYERYQFHCSWSVS